MIAKLTGTVDHVSDTFAIVDVNGVGYKVFLLQQDPVSASP